MSRSPALAGNTAAEILCEERANVNGNRAANIARARELLALPSRFETGRDLVFGCASCGR